MHTEAARMFCTQCGIRAGDGDKFCARCGVRLPSASAESSKPSMPATTMQEIDATVGRIQPEASVKAAAPSANTFGRTVLKWTLHVVGLFVFMMVYLVWKELAMKAGMESALMGAARGVIVFGTYLGFVEWTKSMGAGRDGATTNKPTARITGVDLVKFVGTSIIIAGITYKIAPYNVNPDAVWWVSIVAIVFVGAFIWEKRQKANPVLAASHTRNKE